MAPPGVVGSPVLSWLALAGGAVAYGWGWRQLHRRWLITGLPRSRIRSVALGFAEVGGKGRVPGDATPLRSPVRRLPCVWFRVLVTRRDTDDRGHESTTTILRQELEAPFEVDDGTGRLLILPQGAEFAGVQTCDVASGFGAAGPEVDAFCLAHGIPWALALGGRSYRVQEWALLTDADVSVLGEVARVDAPAADRHRRVSEILRDWAASPEQRARFDANGDGILQPEEWDAARAAAESQALQESVAAGPPPPPVLVVRRPGGSWLGRRPFLVVAGGEEDLIRTTGHPALWIATGVVLLGVAAVVWPGASLAPARWGQGLATGLSIGVPVVYFLSRR